MSLGDLHNKLYSRSDEVTKQKMADDFYDPKKTQREAQPVEENTPSETISPAAISAKKTGQSAEPNAEQSGEKIWLSPAEQALLADTEREKKAAEKKKKVIKIGYITLGGLVVLAAAVFALVKFQDSAFSEEKVLMEIVGPTQVKSGQEVSYEISITNNNRADLESASLKITHSEDFILVEQPTLLKEGFNGARIEVGTLKSQENKRFTIKAKTFGPSSKQIYLNASLIYQPDNFSSTFEKKSQLSGIINASLLNLTLLSTQEAASGEEVELQVIVKNDSQETFADMQVAMEYPEGFTYKRSEPMVTEGNNKWNLGAVAPGQQSKITLLGSVEGAPDTIKTFKAVIGSRRSGAEFLKLNEAQSIIKIGSARVIIEQTINGKKNYIANAGETLEYIITFKNNSEVALRDLVLKDTITSPVLDKGALFVPEGYYDSATNQILWRASDIPRLKILEPGQSGEVRFKVKIMDKFPMSSEADKNFVLSSQASIESLDIDTPLGQNKRVFANTVEVKLNSRLVLNVTGNYNDGEIPNAGPIPMQSGQETTFVFRVSLQNTSNNLKNAVLTTSLPGGVSWKNKTVPELSGIEYNERTHELKWNIGTLEAGTGFILPIKTMAFQIGMVPSITDAGKPVTLLNSMKVTAIDTFTNQPVEYTFGEMTSQKIDDLENADTLVAQ